MGDPARDLGAIYFSRLELERYDHNTTLGAWSWPTDVGERDLRWVEFLGLCARDGAAGIADCEGAISLAYWRTCRGARSSRTTYRAWARIEARGYIRRHKLRIGRDARGVRIEFLPKLLELFAFTRHASTGPKKSVNVCVVPHLPQRQSEDRTISPVPPDPDPGVFTSNATGARKEKRQRWDPVVYTARCVASSARERAVWTWAIMSELRGEHSRSGVDWAYWRSRWEAMTILERENTFALEIRPSLPSSSRSSGGSSRSSSSSASSRTSSSSSPRSSRTPPAPRKPASSCTSSSGAPAPLSLTPDELNALFWADRRVTVDNRADFSQKQCLDAHNPGAGPPNGGRYGP